MEHLVAARLVRVPDGDAAGEPRRGPWADAEHVRDQHCPGAPPRLPVDERLRARRVEDRGVEVVGAVPEVEHAGLGPRREAPAVEARRSRPRDRRETACHGRPDAAQHPARLGASVRRRRRDVGIAERVVVAVPRAPMRGRERAARVATRLAKAELSLDPVPRREAQPQLPGARLLVAGGVEAPVRLELAALDDHRLVAALVVQHDAAERRPVAPRNLQLDVPGGPLHAVVVDREERAAGRQGRAGGCRHEQRRRQPRRDRNQGRQGQTTFSVIFCLPSWMLQTIL